MVLIAASQWRMVNSRTSRVGPINTANIGPTDEGSISEAPTKNTYKHIYRVLL